MFNCCLNVLAGAPVHKFSKVPTAGYGEKASTSTTSGDTLRAAAAEKVAIEKLKAGPRILVLGGGIGGLTAALAVKQRNPAARITIFERRASMTAAALGLGINLLPNCVEVLISLGLEEALRETAIVTSVLNRAGNQGLLLKTEPRGLAAGHAAPQFSIHRGELARILAEAVSERLGADCMKAGYNFRSFDQKGESVVARFDREGGPAEFEGDALVRADGLHSNLRKVLYPHEKKRYSGWVSWRGLTRMESAPFDGSTMSIIGKVQEKDGREAESYGQAFVCYPIDEPTRKRGGALLNWVAEMAVEELPAEEEDWMLPVAKDDIAAAFEGFNYGPIAANSLIAEATTCTKFVMYDRDPVGRWTFGRVTLLGDAAHPMLPFGSLGAGTAILDADALARTMEVEAARGPKGLPLALQRYERARIGKANEIVLRCRGGALHKPMIDFCAQHKGQLPSDLAEISVELGEDDFVSF